MPCQEQPQARAGLPLTPKAPLTVSWALPGTKRNLTIFPGFIVSSPAHPQTLWSRAVALLSISSTEQICAFLPSVWEEDAEPHCRAGGSWPCQWSPGWEPVRPGFARAGLGILLLLTMRIFCQPLQQYHGVSSPIGDRLAPMLCTAVPMGRDVAHPLAAPTWVPPATGTLQLEQLQHCCPPACNSGPDDWQPDSQAHPMEFSFQAHRPCLKIELHRSIDTSIG